MLLLKILIFNIFSPAYYFKEQIKIKTIIFLILLIPSFQFIYHSNINFHSTLFFYIIICSNSDPSIFQLIYMKEIISRFSKSPQICHFRLSFPIQSPQLNSNLADIYKYSKGKVAMFISVSGASQSPEVATTLHETFKYISDKNKLPLYSFLENNVNGLTYYVATAANQIYINPFCLIGDVTAPTYSYTNIHKLLKLLGISNQRIGKETNLWNSLNAPNTQQQQLTKNWLKVIQTKLKNQIATKRSINPSSLQQFGNKILTPQKAVQYKLVDKILTLDQYKEIHYPNNHLKQKFFSAKKQNPTIKLEQQQIKLACQFLEWIQSPQVFMAIMQNPLNNFGKDFIEVLQFRAQHPDKLMQLQNLSEKLVNKIEGWLSQQGKMVI